jgi:uncharacterized caspase-like protein
MLRFLLFVVLAGLVTWPAYAERRVALVMAANDYRSLRPLKNAVNDGRAVEAALKALDFDVISETDRDLRRMRRALEDFREDAAGADVAVVYFAGHGVEIGGENRLLPVDADASSLDALKATSLPLEEIRAAIGAVSRIGLILLDACRNDPFGIETVQGRGAVVLKADVAASVHPGLGRMGRAENVLFAFAAAPGETAADGNDGHSPFSAALSKYLATDGLEIRSVLTLVQQEVYDRSAGRQLPYVESGLPRLFFAATAKEELPERERLLLAMADVTPELRAEVEQIATDADMPLAPLYGALIGSNAAELGQAERSAKLQEAAAAFVKVREELRTLGATDPKVAELRAEAEAQLAEGAFDAAREKLAEAAEIDSRSRQALEGNIAERALSEADTRYISAGAARAELKYRLAIEDFEKALVLFDRVGEVSLTEAQDARRAETLQSLGSLYTTVGDIASARDALERFVTALTRRSEAAQGDADAQHAVAVAYTSLGTAQFTQGSLQEAFASYDAAHAILVKLTAQEERPEWLGTLALVHDKAAEIRLAGGYLSDAAAASAEALKIKQKLVEQAPHDDALKRSLTVTYDMAGDLSRQAGNLADARAAYEASLEIRRALAASYPDDAEAQRDLSISHDNVGDLLRLENQFEAALVAYRAGQAIVERLAKRDPNEANNLRDLALSESKIGNVQRDMDRLDAALESYRTALDITEQLARSDPNNSNWQRDLSIAIEKVADIQRRLGDERTALDGYQRSFDIMSRLVRSDPSNADWLRDISITLGEIGYLKRRARDFSGAAEVLSESLNIRLQLTAAQPDNMLWQRDLMLAYNDFAYVSDDPGRDLRNAIAVAEKLDRAGLLSAGDRKMLDQMRRQLAKRK